ncbi:MAG: hypothetical protein WBO37_02580, partial [Gammaproteobacteria bacterium]
LARLLKPIKQSVHSGRDPALAGLFEGQKEAFEEAHANGLMARSMLQRGECLDRHSGRFPVPK